MEPVMSFVFGSVAEYMCYGRSYENNLQSLRESLFDVFIMKDMIENNEERNDRLEEISGEAAIWLQNVRTLLEDDEWKRIMNKDLRTARLFVVKLMDTKDLKMSLIKEKKVQKIVVKLMKKLREEMGDSNEETKKMAKLDYKHLFKVVVELMNAIIGEFKKSIKNDMKMAIMVTNMLSYIDLQRFTIGDIEMEKIMWEALSIDDGKHEDVDLEKTLVKDVATKLLTPVRYIITHFMKLINDVNFRKDMFKTDDEAEAVKLRLNVIDGLLIKTSGLNVHSIPRYKGYCYGNRYDISKGAEKMTDFIQNTILCTYPYDTVSVIINLESRDKLMFDVLEKLNDDHVDVVGIFGMGGIGKTHLAKKVYKKAKDMFNIKLMVDVSDTPNIVSIQAVIADSINLSLDGIENVAQRATRLYNRLKSEEKILVILDNIWDYINLDEIGIPRTCKLLLTTREKDVCRVMGVRGIDCIKVSVLDDNEARNLLSSETRIEVNRVEYMDVVERLLSECGGLPLFIVTIGRVLKNKDVAFWENFNYGLLKSFSDHVGYGHRKIFPILDFSYKRIKVAEKRMFFLLACLFPYDSGISIESLTRYSIGLGLFRRADDVNEAKEVAYNWVDELISSSMLIEGDVEGEVKIHSIMRAFAISFCAIAEKHKFMVEVIREHFFPSFSLIDDQTFVEYTVMSLMCDDKGTWLEQIKANKLRVLKITGPTRGFNDFFEEMMNLEVLDLADMKDFGCLPKSIWKLKKLRTLCMEGCDHLGNIEEVGELANLLVLSLRGSSMDELPSEITNLSRLLLLDISGCITTQNPISDNFLSSLSQSGVIIVNKKGTNFQGRARRYSEMLPIIRKTRTRVDINLPKKWTKDNQGKGVSEISKSNVLTTNSLSHGKGGLIF